jgi:hypothetical protein
VVTVNLDDKCKLHRQITYGIFIDSGDYIKVTGRENPYAGQIWYAPNCGCMDTNVVIKSQDFEDLVIAEPCYN